MIFSRWIHTSSIYSTSLTALNLLVLSNCSDGLKKIKQFTVDLTSVETNMVSLLVHLLSLILSSIYRLLKIIFLNSRGVFSRYSLISRIHA